MPNLESKSAPSDPGRNFALDGLRGYAALAVSFFHTITALDYTQIQRIEWTTFWAIEGWYGKLTKIVFAFLNGETPVVIFFVLSGVVLMQSLQRSRRGLVSSGCAFLVRRVVRIYPALFVCLVFGWIVTNLLIREVTAEAFWENAALLSFNVNGATWTLQIELLAAPLILFAYIGYRYFKELGLLMFLLAIWLAFRYLPLPSILDTTKGVWTCFALGVLIPTRVGAFAVSLMPRYSWIAAFVVMLGARHLIPDLEISFMVHRCAAALLVALIYYRQAGRLENVLTLPFSKFLGDISYSFYLYAVPPMAVLTAVLLRTYPWIAEHPLEVGIPLGIVVAVVSLPLALASYHWVEKPSIWLGYALTSGPRKVIPA